MPYIEYNTSLDGTTEFELGNDNANLEFEDTQDLAYVATSVADHYWYNHDGWEDHWPMKFEIFADKASLGVFDVDMEMTPYFSARRSNP